MVVKKCLKCKKNITKKIPGLECSRCNKIVHAEPSCSKLSNKQLNTLKNSPGIEWSCEDCMKNISRRSSFIIPDDDEDEDDYETAGSAENPPIIDAQKLVKDISRELKKTFREEIRNLEQSLEFLSEQMSTMEQSIVSQNNKIKELDNKNQDLANKNKNLELRVAVLEQGLKNFEQKELAESLEIAGLPDLPPSETNKLVETVASKLNMNMEDVQSSQRITGSKHRPGPILVGLQSKMIQQRWIDAGRERCLTVGMIKPDVPKEDADKRIYIREALTKHQKSLLYSAKTQLLNKSCQFVWCKNGNVCARKSTNSKIYYIRSLQDINQVEEKCVAEAKKQPEGSTPS